MQNGTVIKMNEKGFGFIKVDGAPEGSKDLFFHSNELRNISFAELKEGDKVSFEIGDSPKGPNALNVSKI
ncbi:MAG: cold shock domain-containing protein [Patescibacteria group bacterium]|nr:cold shock domain-containing protein [Patescibacteria group bacterium]